MSHDKTRKTRQEEAKTLSSTNSSAVLESFYTDHILVVFVSCHGATLEQCWSSQTWTSSNAVGCKNETVLSKLQPLQTQKKKTRAMARHAKVGESPAADQQESPSHGPLIGLTRWESRHRRFVTLQNLRFQHLKTRAMVRHAKSGHRPRKITIPQAINFNNTIILPPFSQTHKSAMSVVQMSKRTHHAHCGHEFARKSTCHGPTSSRACKSNLAKTLPKKQARVVCKISSPKSIRTKTDKNWKR